MIPRFSLSTNVEVDLRFKMTVVNKLKYPYSECKVKTNSDIPLSRLTKKIENLTYVTYNELLCKEIG